MSVPKDSHIIKVEAFLSQSKCFYLFKAYPVIYSKIGCFEIKDMGTGGYILSNQGARALLAFIKEYNKLIPIDHIMFKDYLVSGEHKVYQNVTSAFCPRFYLNER